MDKDNLLGTSSSDNNAFGFPASGSLPDPAASPDTYSSGWGLPDPAAPPESYGETGFPRITEDPADLAVSDSIIDSPFPDITDDFENITIDTTITPPESIIDSPFPDVTAEFDMELEKANALPSSPPKSSIPLPMPSIADLPPISDMSKIPESQPRHTERNSWQSAPEFSASGTEQPKPQSYTSGTAPEPEDPSEDFAGDHYTWNGREYVETDEPSPSYQSSAYGKNYGNRKQYQQTQNQGQQNPNPYAANQNQQNRNQQNPYTANPGNDIENQAKTIKTLGIVSMCMAVLCWCAAMISLIIGIITLAQANALASNAASLSPEGQKNLNAGKKYALAAVIISGIELFITFFGFI